MSATDFQIIDLSPLDIPIVNALVSLSVRAAAMIAPRWLPDRERARSEIVGVAAGPGVCRVLLENGVPSGWIGAQQSSETAWELHPLLVDPDRQRGGVGRCLVENIERHARDAGALTMELSTADATGATTLSGIDLYSSPLDALAGIDVVDPVVGHAFRFWQKVGYTVVGVIPDAEGAGAPSIHLAKPLRLGSHAPGRLGTQA